ncbi:hypothetical protein [Actinomadura miaoliensis]|uniref:hypothetical protein n=1 Tax=Actinomadura miaoliensis TaxID=430685 RepID=UPI0031E92826
MITAPYQTTSTSAHTTAKRISISNTRHHAGTDTGTNCGKNDTAKTPAFGFATSLINPRRKHRHSESPAPPASDDTVTSAPSPRPPAPLITPAT